MSSEGLYGSSGKENDSHSLKFTPSTKREVRRFQVVFLQWRQRNVQKRVIHVQSCCFANPNLLLFCRSRCPHRRRCLSALRIGWATQASFFGSKRAILFSGHLSSFSLETCKFPTVVPADFYKKPHPRAKEILYNCDTSRTKQSLRKAKYLKSV